MKQVLILVLLFTSCNEQPPETTNKEAREFPTKPVRIIEPFGAGGGPDIIARMLRPKLSALWDQPVIVVNHTGNGSTAAPAFVLRSPANGHTLLINTSAQAYSSVFPKELPYDPLKDFIPIAALTTQPYVLLTGKSSGIKTIAELIAAAKKNELKFGSTGVGTGTHIGLEKFNIEASIKGIHVPTQKGETIREVIANTIAGRLTYILAPIELALRDIQRGDLIALGVTTRQRSNLLPGILAIAEAGVSNFDYSIWYGVWVSSNTPDKIVDQLSKDFETVLSNQAIKDSLIKHGATIMNMTQPEFAKFVVTESEMAQKIIKGINMN